MTTRFRPFRSRQRSTRRRSRKANRRRFEMLEDRRLLAADMPFAGEVLDQELDAPSDDLSVTALTAAAEPADGGVVEMRIDASTDATSGLDSGFPRADSGATDATSGVASREYSRDGSIELPPDWIDLFKADFGTVGSDGGVVDAAAYTVWRDNLGATTVSSPSDGPQSQDGSIDAMDVPTEQLSLNFDDDADAGVETPVDAAIADHEPQPPADTSFAGETPVDADVVDQAFELDGKQIPILGLAGETPVDADAVDQVFALDPDAGCGDVIEGRPVPTLEGNEGDTGDASSDTQPPVDTGVDGFPGGLLDTEPGAETTGPEDTGVEFGILDWLLGMDYDDVKTRDDLPDLRKPTYDLYSLARVNGKSHEDASKDAGVKADGKWGKIFKRVYENDNGK